MSGMEDFYAGFGKYKGIIDKLKSEIIHLNQSILNEINRISNEESSTSKILLIKKILIKQREEIQRKNEEIKILEMNVAELTRDIVEQEEKTKESMSSPTYTSEMEAKITEQTKTIEELKETLGRLKFKSLKTEEMEKEIKDLKAKNEELEEKDKKNQETNRMLKAALLMTVEKETQNIADSPTTIKEDTVIEIETSNEKKVALTQGPVPVQPTEEGSEKIERKNQCPKCGATSAFILEIEDRTNILYVNMGQNVYGKKYKCGDCRNEWK